METREERQIKRDAKIAAIRKSAGDLEASSAAIRGSITGDHVFWTQPAGSNAKGRAFARQRNAERAKLDKACEMSARAKQMNENADRMERNGVTMKGDAAQRDEEARISVSVSVGEVVKTANYGLCTVTKVNKKTVVVGGSFRPIVIDKKYISKI